MDRAMARPANEFPRCDRRLGISEQRQREVSGVVGKGSRREIAPGVHLRNGEAVKVSKGEKEPAADK